MAKLISINISEKKGVVKKPVEEALLIEDFGIENDAHAGKWHRQVSLLGKESVDKMVAKGLEHLKPGDFAENLLTKGIVLYELPIGTILSIGKTIHEVTQIGKECHTGCEIKQLTGDCVMPREGIFTKVLKGGMIKPGDDIEIIEEGKKDLFDMK